MKDYRQEERNKTIRIRSMMDLIMGSLFLLIGLYFLLYEALGINVLKREPSPVLDIVIGVVFILYGVWRIYRGYKKEYYR